MTAHGVGEKVGHKMDNRAIGYFDSGVGGLTVVKQALHQLPNEQIKYVGDTARMPYGPRTSEELKQFAMESADFLVGEDIKLLVIACNTATAQALPMLQEKLDIPVVGVIHPGIQAALEATADNKIGVIATEGTVNSNTYYNGLLAIQPHVTVAQLATPELVQIAEHKDLNAVETHNQIKEVVAPLVNSGIDTLVMGCTHFPLMADSLQRIFGDDVTLVDAGAEAVNTVEKILDAKSARHEIIPMVDHTEDEYFTTGDVTSFAEMGTKWLGLPINVSQLMINADGLEKVNIHE